MGEFEVIGKSLPRVDAFDRVTGKATYTDDIKLHNMLYGKVLGSPYAHAKILNIDKSRAEKLSGVKAIITAFDVPDVRWGFMIKDQPLFARDKVLYIGEPIAAVAAIDRNIAEEALDLIEVEYEELKPIFDPEEAMKPDTPLIHEEIDSYAAIWPAIKYGNICSQIKIKRGDIEKAFKESDYIFEDRFTTKMQHHGYIELHSSIAKVDLDGKVTIWTTTQAPFMIRLELAEVLRMPISKIRVITEYLGGGFGGKTDIFLEPYAAILSQRTNRPVKITLSRKEEILTNGPRLRTIIDLKTGTKKDGTILAREAKLIYDTGAYACVGPGVVSLGVNYVLGPYNIPNIKIDGYCVYTNRIRGGWMRGPGAIQSTFASESQIDMIAEKLKIDPLELRLKNAVEDGDLSATGQILHGVGLKESLKRVAEKASWGKQMDKNKGIGLGCAQYEVVGMGSSAFIRVNEDGTVGLIIGAVDIGGGQKTVLAQIVAEVLGIPVDDIKVVSGDTDSTPYDAGTFGDRVTFNMGNAVRIAAEDAKTQILRVAAGMLESKVEDLEIKERKVYVRGTPERGVNLSDISMASYFFMGGPILGKGGFFGQTPPYDTQNVEGHGFPSAPAHTFASQVIELGVNPDNGKVKISRVTSAHDVGFPINPLTLEGQIRGSILMGIGYSLMEEIVEENGMILNPNLTDYKLPNILDLPEIEPIIFGKKVSDGPFGAKGGGNPGIILPPAPIANAIYNAVGVRIKELPITPEKILKALKEKHG
jgi:CO/xanthine dehydrogenase Mo-binding subunit